MRVVKLLFMKVGGQQTQFSRPFHSRVDQNIQNEFNFLANNKEPVLASNMIDLSSKIIFPNPQISGIVNIPNGWENQKLIFFMEIEDQVDYAGSTRTQVITGFTDKCDYSFSGTLAPDTKLYFNNSVSILESTVWTPNGQTKSRRMENSAHILHAEAIPSIRGPSALSLRPVDVFGVLASDALVNDTSVIDCTAMFHNGMQLSSRKDEFSPTYIEKAFKSYDSARNNHHGSDQALYYDAKNYSKQMSSNLSNFVMKLKANSSLAYSDFVTYEELCTTFNVDQIAQIFTQANQVTPAGMTSTYTAANTCNWNGANYETIDANYLIHALPALMVDMLISDVSLASTNDTLNGEIKTVIQGVEGFSSKIDMRNYIQAFINRFEFEHMRRLTNNNQRLVKLNLNMNLMGESYIKLQYDNNHAYEFLAPSFADGFFSPLITRSQDDLRGLVHTFDTLFSNTGTDVGGIQNSPISLSTINSKI